MSSDDGGGDGISGGGCFGDGGAINWGDLIVMGESSKEIILCV